MKIYGRIDECLSHDGRSKGAEIPHPGVLSIEISTRAGEKEESLGP
jgi:hypothetical protein